MSSSDRKTSEPERPSSTDRIRDGGPGRVILFPTEASNLGRDRIKRAVDRVTLKN
jgi:hypothetical protein